MLAKSLGKRKTKVKTESLSNRGWSTWVCLEVPSAAGSPRGIEVALAEPLPGWRRFRPAERWLQNWQAEVARTQRAPVAAERRAAPTTQEGSAEITDPEVERLFREFLEWRRRRGSAE
jgi:hypothetical protein